MPQEISDRELTKCDSHSLIDALHVQRRPDGWYALIVRIRDRIEPRVLMATRGRERRWAHLDKLVGHAQRRWPNFCRTGVITMDLNGKEEVSTPVSRTPEAEEKIPPEEWLGRGDPVEGEILVNYARTLTKEERRERYPLDSRLPKREE
ncbi:MAG: hypothetical protein F4Y89_14765 [Gammaproteobacteria bacterium]|nr:hypothetical protein [Gammaproteobacteria bacterium]MXY91784.1 hypothetical protein [Gammaproteobacteria bacterium]MYG95037.1 hypothetical protein [Gammaproteobacteria bacterium]